MLPINKTMIVGEPGSTTYGELDRMLMALEVAARCRLDAVKFQFLTSAKSLVCRRNIKEYSIAQKYEKAYELVEWSDGGDNDRCDEMLEILRKKADELQLKLGLSVYLPDDIEFLSSCGMRFDFIKFSSFEAFDGYMYWVYNDCLRSTPLVVSTGLHTQGEIEDLVKFVEKKYPKLNVKFLHCISSYPTPVTRTQIRVVQQPWCYGLSDHSHNMLTGALAVAVGARMVEVHYLASDDVPHSNLDRSVSHEEYGLNQYVQNIKLAEEMMGSQFGERFLYSDEADNRKYISNGSHIVL